MREGNNQKVKGKISVGTIASKITLEGPILKNKLSYILSFRQTYANLLTLPFQKSIDGESYNYGFNDYNAKLNYKINDKHQVYLSGYMGRDRYK
jgi:outer membrane receptor for ferrienterochelin and colicin